jgi:hypothetical protein
MTSARVPRGISWSLDLAQARPASGLQDPPIHGDRQHKPARVAARPLTGPAGSPVRAVFPSSSGAVQWTTPDVDWLPEAQPQPLLEAAVPIDRTGTVLLPAPAGRPPTAAACADLPIGAGRPLGGGPNPCGRRFRESPFQAREPASRRAPPRFLASHSCSPSSR